MDHIDRIHKWNGDKLGDLMIQLFLENNSHVPTSEAEVSDYYKSIMLNREVSA